MKALEGDLASVIYLSERVEGKPRAVISGSADEPIAVTIARGDDAVTRISQAINRIAQHVAVPTSLDAVAVAEDDEPK